MIITRNMKKIYKMGKMQVEALSDINIHINPLEFVAIMGPSGSGKSTLMNLLGLLDRPSAGTYLLDSEEVSGLDDNQLARRRNQKLGFVFQSFNLLQSLTALKNVELPMLYAGVKSSDRRRKAAEALEKVGLKDRLQHKPFEMSGGQNQRVAIARAIVNNPSVILADEPTGALDSHTGLEIINIFKELNKNGTTVILVTHEPDIARHARRILHFKDGIMINDEPTVPPGKEQASL